MNNLPIRLAISGALGKMGKTLIIEIQKQKNICLGAALVKKNDPHVNQDIGEIIGIGKLNIKITDKLENIINKFDVLIDFSHPYGSKKYINTCVQTNKNIIIGTTGFNEETKKLIYDASKKIGIVWSSNFSIGINLINKLLEIITKTIGNDSDIDIIESHHRDKIDAPSGTALTMAETIATTMNWNLKEHSSYIHIGQNKPRNKEQINFAAIRAGDIIGKHTVLFSTIGEQIEITHSASNRQTFAKGAITAAKWISSYKRSTVNQSAVLMLEDGSIFYGKTTTSQTYHTVGEVVFNTSMTGYQEILTDPSYSHQLVTLTYPHIGNTGINDDDKESYKIYAKGLIIRDISLISSNYRSISTLSEYLEKHKIVVITHIDTRKLTNLIRNKGSQKGCILTGNNINYELSKKLINNFVGLNGLDLAKKVSTKKIYTWTRPSVYLQHNNTVIQRKKSKSSFHVVVYDFGVKHSILHTLTKKHCYLTVVPATTPAKDALNLAPDGIFLSNGPGDPRPCTYAINAIQFFLKINIPIFGICLGHQLLALSSGATIVKMKFGHHGANHPVQNIKTKKVMITSQNHGFTVDMNNLPKNIEITHRSLFDGTLQGICRTDKLAFGFQGHPEAGPGPHDAMSLFDNFITYMLIHRTNKLKNHK